jgi:hypothetical protein
MIWATRSIAKSRKPLERSPPIAAEARPEPADERGAILKVPTNGGSGIRIIPVKAAETRLNRTASDARAHLAKESDAKANSLDRIVRLEVNHKLENGRGNEPAARVSASEVTKVIKTRNRIETGSKEIEAEKQARRRDSEAVASNEMDKEGERDEAIARTAKASKDRGDFVAGIRARMTGGKAERVGRVTRKPEALKIMAIG